MTKSIRIISSNLWHGLDHTRPLLMLPVENPLESYLRNQAMMSEFVRLRAEPSDSTGRQLDLFCIQEGNPVRRAARKFSKQLKMSHAFAEANVGVRVGQLSYPFLLQEGLITLWSEELQHTNTRRVVLSNPIPETCLKVAQIDLPMSFQLAERRVALLATGTWQGLTIGVANLHVHHGPPEGTYNRRRKEEFEVLRDVIQLEAQRCDLFFVVGDFNCEKHHLEYQIIQDLGFCEISTDPQNQALITWDPQNNPVCSRSAKLNDPEDPAVQWDSVPHQFDHIMVRVKKTPGALPSSMTYRATRIFDQPISGHWISDHYGLCAELSWDDQAA
jgi:endonuclease/exonuclease/phosphatase family metal-dependent hydrolase